MTSRYLFAFVALIGAACGAGSPTSVDEFGRVVTSGDTVTLSGGPRAAVHQDSLTMLDGSALPCCTTDSAGAHVQVTGGKLTFFAATTYGEMAPTPGGIKPVACVQGTPNGSILYRNYLLKLVDGEEYLLMPCTAGYFTVTLTEQVTGTDGASTQREVTLSSGRYGWQRDLLSLRDQPPLTGAAATLSADTITITMPGHRYSFLALPRP